MGISTKDDIEINTFDNKNNNEFKDNEETTNKIANNNDNNQKNVYYDYTEF